MTIPLPRGGLFAVLLATGLAGAGPAGANVIYTGYGQVGPTPGAGDRLESNSAWDDVSGNGLGDPGLYGDGVRLSAIEVQPGTLSPMPEIRILRDRIHGQASPELLKAVPSPFTEVALIAPDAARSPNGNFLAVSFGIDGSLADTATFRAETFNGAGTSLQSVTIAADVDTFTFFPDTSFAKTGGTVDDQGRLTVAYTELDSGAPRVLAKRVNAATGAVVDSPFLIAPVSLDPDLEILDAQGNKVVGVSSAVSGSPQRATVNIIDYSGQDPVVGSAIFPFSAPIFGDVNPVVAADTATGNFLVVAEQTSGVSGNPVDLTGRFFDSSGSPLAGQFTVNSTTANAQGQPSADFGPGGYSAVVWAGDPVTTTGGDDLDVFLQVYDAARQPVGGEIRVNPMQPGVQDNPKVSFLDELDAQGRPQLVVIFRDVGSFDGSNPNGTGRSFACFSIEGAEVGIFHDDFNSGNDGAWDERQN